MTHTHTCDLYSRAIKPLIEVISAVSCFAWPTNICGSWDNMARNPALARGMEKCSRMDSSTSRSLEVSRPAAAGGIARQHPVCGEEEGRGGTGSGQAGGCDVSPSAYLLP